MSYMADNNCGRWLGSLTWKGRPGGPGRQLLPFLDRLQRGGCGAEEGQDGREGDAAAR